MLKFVNKKILVFLLVFTTPALVSAYDINEKLSVEGTLTGVYQYADFDIEGMDDADRGAAVFDFGVNLHPSDSDEFQITVGFASGNALNSVAPFSLVPYADDLEDDLKDINGRNRDYLLEAWYKHTFTISENVSLGITGGIINAGGYIDDNNFANDEIAQFMNDIFVNSTLANLPSYDLGGVVELDVSNFSIRGIAMNTKNEDDKNFNYYALQFGSTFSTSLGEGNYRIYSFTTSDKFQNRGGTGGKRLQGFGISADQQLNEIFGVFARIGWQYDDAVIDHDTLYSGGINVNGKRWDRENDEVGVGYAYLDGVDKGDIENTDALEAYVKFQVSGFSDVTLDIQYLNDNMKQGEDQDGVVYGVRLNAYF